MRLLRIVTASSRGGRKRRNRCSVTGMSAPHMGETEMISMLLRTSINYSVLAWRYISYSIAAESAFLETAPEMACSLALGQDTGCRCPHSLLRLFHPECLNLDCWTWRKVGALRSRSLCALAMTSARAGLISAPLTPGWAGGRGMYSVVRMYM